MKKYNLKKIMTDAHILFRALKERGISFGECLRRIWNEAKNYSCKYFTDYKPTNYNTNSTPSSAYYHQNSTGLYGAHYVGD